MAVGSVFESSSPEESATAVGPMVDTNSSIVAQGFCEAFAMCCGRCLGGR